MMKSIVGDNSDIIPDFEQDKKEEIKKEETKAKAPGLQATQAIKLTKAPANST